MKRILKSISRKIVRALMKLLFGQFIILGSFCLRLPAQTSLECFTNQANTLLQAQFGFAVTNIPVYSSANPAIGYNPSVHYLLQSAANAYDATTPATDFPSVFRPLFFATNYGGTNQALFVVGYANVTNDFLGQISCGFKVITDPTISLNDNVWGIPWVVGAKNNVPAFNEYCYSSAVNVERRLLFVRIANPTNATLGDPNRPPRYTNQFLIMSVSNLFGADAWNPGPATFTNSVTLLASNQVSIILTNNYNGGTTQEFTATTNWLIDSWQGWQRLGRSVGFQIPLLTTTVPLPPSYWSESSAQFLPMAGWFTADSFLPMDLQQTGWPVHSWTLTITNDLMYALMDNATGQVLDFVNLGPFGSSMTITEQLITNTLGPNTTNLLWPAGDATDQPDSPMSSGVLDQIATGMATNQVFSNSIMGIPTVDSPLYFLDPCNLSANFLQNCSWHAINPLVHYTIADLTDPMFNQEVVDTFQDSGPSLANEICRLGEVTPDYNCGGVTNVSFNIDDGLFQIGFPGVVDLPYTVWASTNILDWDQIGIASQPTPGIFQFQDLAATNYPARFYQVRRP